jgi:hypothetical protein
VRLRAVAARALLPSLTLLSTSSQRKLKLGPPRLSFKLSLLLFSLCRRYNQVNPGNPSSISPYRSNTRRGNSLRCSTSSTRLVSSPRDSTSSTRRDNTRRDNSIRDNNPCSTSTRRGSSRRHSTNSTRQDKCSTNQLRRLFKPNVYLILFEFIHFIDNLSNLFLFLNSFIVEAFK